MTVTVAPSEVFHQRRNEMWKAFLDDKDYTRTAELAAAMLQDSFAFDAIHCAGLALASMGGAVDEAFDYVCASLALSKPDAQWYINAINVFKEKRDFVRAMLFVKNGKEAYPDDYRLTWVEGIIFCEMQEWDTALACFDKTLEINPEFHHAKLSIGFCKHMQQKYDEAIAIYNDLMPLSSGLDYEEVVNNLSCVMLELGDIKEARRLLDEVCVVQDRPGTVYNRSFIELGCGEWPQAWHHYRTRRTIQVAGNQGIPEVPIPIAQTLDDLKDKVLFLFHEQGLGDSLMFIRYAPILFKYVKALVIGVPYSMRRMASSLDMPPHYRVIYGADLQSDQMIIRSCDYALPMLDAPALLDQRTDNIPNKPYFLLPPEGLIAKHNIAQYCRPNKLRVGVVWAGSSRPDNLRAHSIDKRRSMTFDQMAPLFDLDADFISLQMPDHHVDDYRIIQPLQEGFDVMDTAAVLQHLDMVITIDSAVVHLSAAYGKPTWMLSRLDQCWRWRWDGRTDSDWYPSLTIYQQKRAGDWNEVIDRVYTDLNKLICERAQEHVGSATV